MESTFKELISSQDRTRVLVLGAGGTGSAFVEGLGAMNQALVSIGHPGLAVTVFDDDEVEPHNIGRQRFGASDRGQNKAEAIVARTNRMYLSDFCGYGHRPDLDRLVRQGYNITVTAVDNNATRRKVQELFRDNIYPKGRTETQFSRNFKRKLYWLDMGNGPRFGQVVLGSVGKMATSIEVFGIDHFKDNDDTPSCGAEDSLRKQDLFINRAVATQGLHMMWTMFRSAKTTYNATFINLETGRTRSAFYTWYQRTGSGSKDSEREAVGHVPDDTLPE